MGSQLINLRRTLQWSDFGPPRAGPDPPPGATATAAQTRATHNHSIHAEPVPGTNPPVYRLKDDVTVTITLQRHQMFVNAWVFRRDTAFQNNLLHHEQGHYDLVALLCRDMFIELMDLKTQTFTDSASFNQAINGVFGQFDPPIASVHALYDNDAQHGRNAQQQQRWDNFIQTAFTRLRNPPESAPDGTPYKVPILDVLQAGGVQI